MIDTYFRLYSADQNFIYSGRVSILLPRSTDQRCRGFRRDSQAATDPAVLESKWYQLREYKVGGRVAVNGLGSHAEYLSVPWKNAFPIPTSSPSKPAQEFYLMVSLPYPGTEAYNIQKGDTILIHTVAGGLGLLFTALAKSRGATVIGTTSTPRKLRSPSRTGQICYLYTKEDTVKRVLEITGGRGHVPANFDCCGGRVRSWLWVTPQALRTPSRLEALSEEHKARSSKDREDLPFTVEGVRAAQTELATPGNKIAGKLLIKIADV
ncbi:hypothetical protein BC629DRAFT_1626538 [Irpex lacteus]|nr:hypothetical protein BC629DRAFT_1626538 [Irpex lacteus]